MADKTLIAVQPNAGLQQLYKRRLLKLVDCMHRSVTYWLTAAYRANEPAVAALAQDATSADVLRKVMKELSGRWEKRFDEGAKDLAKYFAQSAGKRSDKQLKAILKKAGFSVEFKMTKAQRDIIDATVNENVALIKSIPAEYFKNVEGDVMRSVQVGRDVGGLAKTLQKSYGVTKRRAQLISRDQNAKATATMQRARHLELGIEEAEWMHSSAGKTFRRTHVKQSGKRYNIKTGWYDPDAKVWCWPGTLINCKCTSRPIIEGFI